VALSRHHAVCEIRFVPRQSRLDYPGAVHHVFVRGNARSAVAVDDLDYQHALNLLERAALRFEFVCHAWCYLPNHAHLLLTSKLGNLSRAMHWLGTCSAHAFNQRHNRSGHLYQGRFGSKLVEDEQYFLELARYLPLNPVRARLCRSPEDWLWSSYSPTAGLRPAPAFLDTAELVGMLGSPDAYVAWVEQGVDDAILDERGFRRPPPRPPLETLLAHASDDAIRSAHALGYRQDAIAEHLGVSQAQISRRLREYSGVRHE
jgi:REP element-mobilizing transposase RayT